MVQYEASLHTLIGIIEELKKENKELVSLLRKEKDKVNNIKALLSNVPKKKKKSRKVVKTLVESTEKEVGSIKDQHVFSGKPDDRFAGDIKTSRFRPRYRSLSVEEKGLHDSIKDKAQQLESLFEETPHGLHKTLSLIALEEAVMWSIKQLTS